MCIPLNIVIYLRTRRLRRGFASVAGLTTRSWTRSSRASSAAWTSCIARPTLSMASCFATDSLAANESFMLEGVPVLAITGTC